MRLVTWNLNARRRQLSEQVAALAARTPDMVALQEVTASSAELLSIDLPGIGLSHVLGSFGVAPAWEATGPRRYGLVIAS